MADSSIDRLSLSTQTKLRSTQILTSLPQIISELFQNSLDAGSKHIEIGVNCTEWSCWVTDDGCGMSKDTLNSLGTEGRYQSSKAYSPDTLDCLSTFGFRGEALASAADLSCLEIASRTSRSRETWSIILKDGKTLYAGSAVRWRRESHGTTVCVRDAFYNLPVRRRSHPSPSRIFEIIRGEIVSWAIMHPNVSFALEDSQAKLAGSSKSSILKIPKTSSCIDVFRHLYGRALCHHIEEISLASNEMKLEGFISLDGALSKAYQFLYVNRHPISSGDMHRIIDTKFAASSFAKNAFDEIGATQLTCSATRRSPRKTERRPVYVLNLLVPPHQIDNLLEPAKGTLHFQNRSAVAEFLSSSIVSFLVRHGFTGLLNNTTSTGSPRKRKRLDFEHDSRYAEVVPEEYEEDMKVPPAPLNLYAVRFNEISKPDETNEMVWTDPNTGEIFIVDARTGNSRPQTQPRLTVEDADENCQSQVLRQRRTLCLPNTGSTDKSRKGPAPEWIQEALEANDTYAITERRIAEVTVGSASEMYNCLSDPQTQYQQRQHFSRLFLSTQGSGDSSVHTQHRFTKNDIRKAQVISQVDRKFVACVFNEDLANGDLGKNKSSTKKDDKQSTLVLIDQATDERIRVERFLKDLCLGFLRSCSGAEEKGIEMRHLTPPVPILLTRHEASRLVRSQQIESSFRSWGIRFADLAQVELELDTSTTSFDRENDRYVQVLTVCIPEVVADKLTMGNELRDLVKGYLAQLESDLPDMTQIQGKPETEVDASDWLKALRRCPRELLDLVNSKACRGAIMFNDSLTNEQCTRLVHQLSETVLPFQCAHGRPSLVPLANLGKLSGNGGSPLRRFVGWSALDQQSSLE
ncbi:hypothetical protein J3R30DRAFT_3289200 [Lentinula aciculospora]|uniref:MutL C-terminal dimerisation domain-containing protein n=1 Tax=Lentinula aciculospora TaxID=153920 RepID=A0A9W9AEK8_9AGAR|nr:hypothetical protein J3R30DRAFT_3289200 [Lentinula aciculospora]